MRYSIETDLSPSEALERLETYFGEQGLGLTLQQESACCMRLEGGGGHVQATVVQQDDQTVIDLETREWDYHVRQFMVEV
ncbi:MAG: hypothetical protein ACLFU8_04690 [Anaerolineales bacterium]